MAAGELALEKHDYALAARTFQEGLKTFPDDPDLHFGLARAYAPSEPALAQASLEAALKVNTNHVPSLLLLADAPSTPRITPAAEMWLDRVEAVNPWHPEAWAYRAVLARLRNEPAREQAAREMAPSSSGPPTRACRISSGASSRRTIASPKGSLLQREALAFDPTFLPAKAQLAQDLLRLGEDEEGWRLAEEVHRQDGYDVAALNLVTLRDTMATVRRADQRAFHRAHDAPRGGALRAAGARTCSKRRGRGWRRSTASTSTARCASRSSPNRRTSRCGPSGCRRTTASWASASGR